MTNFTPVIRVISGLLLGVMLGSPVLQAQTFASAAPSESSNQRPNQSTKQSLKTALQKVEQLYGVHFVYEGNLLENKQVVFESKRSERLETLLKRLMQSTNLRFRKLDKTIYAILPIKTEASRMGAQDTSYLSLTSQAGEGLNSFVATTQPAQLAVLPVEIPVKGRVTNGEGEVLPGVSVSVKGTTSGTITDAKGDYTLNAPHGEVILIFSFIGYVSEEIPLKNQSIINVSLLPDIKTLSEVVVIGYGEQKREDITGAISSVRGEALKNLPQPSVEQLIQGRLAGVSVTNNSGQPGSMTSVRIRGITSLTGSNEPLYVIDGVPVSGDGNNSAGSGNKNNAGFDWAGGGSGQTANSPLQGLNPSDILSIDVLKDASATAIYGSRASNGVIIITTKRGKSGESKISYDAYFGWQGMRKYLPMMDLPQYAKLQNEMAPLYGQQPREEFRDLSLLGKGSDWQHEVFQTAPMQSHQLGFSGGKEKLQYYISAGYLHQAGVVIGSDFDRFSMRINLDNQVNRWLKVGTNFTANRTKERITLNDDQEGIIATTLLQAPDVAVRNPDGSYGGPTVNTGGTAVQFNPVAKALVIDNYVTTNNVLGNLYADISLLKDLSFRTELGTTLTFSKNDQFRPSYKWGILENPTAQALKGANNSYFWILKNYLTYKHNFSDKHDITMMLGHEAQEAHWEGVSATRQNFPDNNIKELSVGDKVTQTGSSYLGSSALESYFGRFIYSFGKRYILTATLRADGSSKFDPHNNKQWGYFPSVALAWTISNEAFMQNVDALDNLKLRVGYGAVGNQNIPNNRYGSALNAIATGFGTGFGLANYANPNLQWESAIQTNVGLDFSILKGRVDVSADWFNKISSNFLYQLPLPAYTGTSGSGSPLAPYVNLGKMQNKGFEFAINTHNIKNADFSWNTTLVLSRYVNNVQNINGLVINKAVQFNTINVNRTEAGQPMSQFYGYKVAGIFRTQEQLDKAPRQFGGDLGKNGNSLGDIQYEDVNHDGRIDTDDQTYIGTPHPQFTYGFTNTFAYKSFDLSIFVQGSQGNKAMNIIRRVTQGLDRVGSNQLASSSDYWTAENPNASLPRLVIGNDNPNLFVSDRYVEDASYVRIQNISLGYVLPALLTKKINLNRFRVYASVQNLYTFTQYSGYDPEIGAFNQDPLIMNVDNGRYPSPRTFTVGFNAEF